MADYKIDSNGRSRYVGPWSHRPNTSDSEGKFAYFTDVGNGMDAVCKNGVWMPINGSQLLVKSRLPVALTGTFTGSTNGAIVQGVACETIMAKCYVYYPANSLVASHDAGFYYTEMSSTTAGIAYNNTYVPAPGVFPTAPTTKVAFSGAVPGGTGLATGTAVTAFSFTVPESTMDLWGELVNTYATECTSSTDDKIFSLKVGSTVLGTTTITDANQTKDMGTLRTRNMGSASVQRTNPKTGTGATNTDDTITAINTGNDVQIDVVLEKAVAGDVLALVAFSSSLELF